MQVITGCLKNLEQNIKQLLYQNLSQGLTSILDDKITKFCYLLMHERGLVWNVRLVKNEKLSVLWFNLLFLLNCYYAYNNCFIIFKLCIYSDSTWFMLLSFSSRQRYLFYIYHKKQDSHICASIFSEDGYSLRPLFEIICTSADKDSDMTQQYASCELKAL